jgi:pimeloyl-ACP methyl ester carboxylesterase
VTETLYSQTFGSREDPALLLVHPLGATSDFWTECAERWSGRFYSVAVDLRSTGKSPKTHTPAGVERHVDDLKQLVDALGVGTVVPIGCALGSLVTARFAAKYPERTAALVMANPGLDLPEAAQKNLGQRAEFVRRSGTAPLLPDAVDRIFHNLPHGELYDRYVQAFRDLDPVHHANEIVGLLDADVSKDLPTIRCPVLLVPAEHDMLEPPESVGRVAALLPDARTEMLMNSAHFGPYQASEAFTSMVGRFLQDARVAIS